MRVFNLLDSKKSKQQKIHRAPTSTTNLAHDVQSSRRNKIIELFGAVREEERLQIDALLRMNEANSEQYEEDITDEEYYRQQNALELLNLPVPELASDAKLTRPTTCPQIQESASGVALPAHDAGFQISYSQRHPSSARSETQFIRPPLSHTVLQVTSTSVVHSQYVDTVFHGPAFKMLPRPCENASEHGTCLENKFPLPSPNPDQRQCISPSRLENVAIIAHPLPQPPTSYQQVLDIDVRKQILPCKDHVSNYNDSMITSNREPATEADRSCKAMRVTKAHRQPYQHVPSRSEMSVAGTELSYVQSSSHHQTSKSCRFSSPSPCTKSPPSLTLLDSGPGLSVPSSPHALLLPPSKPFAHHSTLPWVPLPAPAALEDHKPSALPRVSQPSSSVYKSFPPGRWMKGQKLGQGSFGTVYAAWNVEDGSFFAVKMSSSKDEASLAIQQEIDVLSKLQHPNIVQYLGSSVEDGHLCIFLELLRMGSLDKILNMFKQNGDDTIIRIYTRQILLGLEYLHSKNTIHRDIKCSNILVDVNGQVKLSDFSIAKQVGDSLISSVEGTLLYMAPEVLTANPSATYSFPADIWSLGCTVFEMANGKPPWSNLGFGFIFKVKDGELPLMPKHLSQEGKNFICNCLKYDPQDRPTASELLRHPFVANIPESFVPWSPSSPTSLLLCQESSSQSANTWTCRKGPVSPSRLAVLTK